MATNTRRHPGLLETGDTYSRAEFHDLYERTPDGFRAELIAGTVFLPPRVTAEHGSYSVVFAAPLLTYENSTPGTVSAGRLKLLLDGRNEPEPDACLRVRPENGGNTRETADGYLAGPPELICEVAYSDRSLDFHAKREEYGAAGVLEFLMFNLQTRTLHRFDLPRDREVPTDADGVHRLTWLPGLWLDTAAFAARDARALMATVQRGLATPEHAAFVAALAARKVTPA